MIKIFEVISENKFTKDNCLVIYEYFFKRDIKEEIKKLEILKESHFGDKKVIYLSPG
jgi:16S rRNA G966 N2-methylase RsmD